jgi:hypothetical protein
VNASVGLCAQCRHARIIENRRGSRFWLCSRSHDDPRFPRYPGLPVIRCIGFETGAPRTTDQQEQAADDQ